MARAFIGLGSNLQHPQQQVLLAIAKIMQLPHSQLLQHSSLYKTAPVGYDDQPDFINAVVEIETKLSPLKLLRALLEIENKQGRQRSFANAPRVLDCDLLWYQDMVMRTATLTLPHPRMHQRGFVLLPLAEIAPDLLLKNREKASDLAKLCGDQGVVKITGTR